MPKYIVNDKVYNIPDDKVKGFESKYPDARVVYYNEGKTYKLPLGKRDGFLKQYPSASLEMPANDNAATASQPTRQAAVAVPASAAVPSPSPSVDDKVEPVTAAMPASEGDSQEYAVGFGAGVKEGGKALWGGIKSAAGETSKLAVGSKDDYARAVERIYEMNDVGYDMSDFNAERAVRDHKMRQYEHDMEEYKKEIAKRKAERKGMGFFESIGHKMSDPQRPRDPFDRSASSTAKMYSPEGMTSEIELQRSYKLVEEALRENGGDIDEAKKWLIKQAKTDTWGDKTSEDAQQMLSEVKPTQGTAAWVGNMIPQMTGNMLAIGASLSPWTRWMSRPLGMANMAALTASSAGSSMADARMYGEETGTDVSTGDVWAAGGTSALIEAGTEAIPFNRMFGGVQHATKKALGKAIGDVLTNNSAARTELVQLVERAQKELGKDLFSGKNAKEWIVDMGYEGMSEFLAEGGGALVPMIYANEEDYPTLSEVLKSGWEGAKGGIFMGAFLGGANRAVGHYHNRNRRKEQGYVDLAETKDGKVVEVLGKETKEFDDGTEEMTYSVMMPDGSLEHVSPTDIVDSKRISFEEFEHGVTAKMEADVADAYEEGRALMDEESDEGLIDARNGYELAKENLARNVGCEVEELEDALLGGGVYGSLEERLRNFNPENWGEEHTGLFVDYMNARARYNGMIERVQDDIDGKVATALQHIDDNRGADGNITPAVLVDEELDVYVVNRSGDNVVVRDGNGQLRMVSSDQVRLTGEPISAETAKAEAEERIREEESAAAAARIDGAVQLVPGNVYPILIGDEVTGEDTGQSSTITIMQDNGDGTAVVMLGGDERQQLTLSVDAIQGMVDTHHRMRLEAAAGAALVGGTAPTTEQQTMATGQQTASNSQESVQEAAPATALERIPVNEQGEQDFEKAPVADSWAALLELNEGDAVEAKDTAEQMVQEAQKALEKEQKKKAAGGSTIMEIQKAKAAHKAMLRGLQSRVEYWTRVANYEEDMRKAEAEAKRRQRRMEQAERGRQLASAGRYTEEYRALGPSQSFREYVLRAISSGGVKFIWSNNDNGTKGLGAHLGLNTPSERGKRLWLQSNSEGMYPELAAQSLLEGYAAEQGMMGYADEETGMDTMDALNEVLDVLGSYDSPSAMFEEVQRMRSEQEEYDADEYAEQEALYQLEQEAEANRMSVNEWTTYNEMLAEHINDVFDTVTDEEILSIFANEYEERDYERSRIDDALEQGVSEGQRSVEGDGGGRRMVQADGRADGGDIAGRGEPSSHGVDDGGQQGIGELSSPSVSGEHREIAGLDGYTESDVKDLVREHVEDIISVEGFEDVRIVGIKVIGSRVNGNATEESDLDVLVEYEGNAREDSLFNLFNGGDVHAQLYIEGIQVDINPITRGKSGTIEQWMERNAGYSKPSLGEQIKDAETEVNINPTDKQKEAGNYKKGHVQISTFNVTIEQPRGSVRSGVDKGGKKWEVEMQNTYGYIRGTEGVDGDHIDVFLSDDIDGWDGHKVFVVDQRNADGSFDEHKVMLGFNDINDAEAAYMSNYEEGWQGLGAITGVSIEEFEKWIASSHRKTKAFAEYKSVKTTEGQSASAERRNLAEAQTTSATASQHRGQKSLFDVAAEIAEKAESAKWHYSVSVDKETGSTTLRREDISGVIPIGDARFSVTASSPQEMLDILRNPQNGMQEALDAVGVTLENKIRTRRMDVAVNDQPKKVDVGGVFTDLSEKGEAKLSDHVEQPANVSGNKLVTDERYAELRERMRNKLNGRMNMGVDPEILAIGTEMAVYHIEKGARRFAEFAKAMIADLGDAIRPYLKSFYNGARELPEMESAGLTDAMTPYDEVRTFDVANFDKASTDMAAAAEEVIKEQEVAEQEQTAKEAIKKERKKRGKSKESLPLLGDLFNTNTEKNHERRDQETHQGVGREERQEGEGAGSSVSAQSDDRQSRIDRAVAYYRENVDDSPEAIAAAERDQQRYEADMAEDAAEIVETLENGDVRRTNRNSLGEIATVAIERDGNVISVDTYEDGALFERTDYDANGNATKVTRYKDGEVVSEQEYKDGKRKVTANVEDIRRTPLSELEYVKRETDRLFNEREDQSLSREEWELTDEGVDAENAVIDSYPSYIQSLSDSGELQRMFDLASVGEEIQIRRAVEAAGFELDDVVDTSVKRANAKAARDKKRAEKAKKLIESVTTNKEKQNGSKEAIPEGGSRGRRSEKQGENQGDTRQSKSVIGRQIEEFELRTGWSRELSDTERLILEDVRKLTDSEIDALRNEAIESIERGEDVEDIEIVLSLLEKYGRSGERLYILSKSGIIPNQPVSLDKVEQLFMEYNEDEGLAILFDRLRPIIEQINPKITFEVIRDVDGNVKDSTVGDFYLKDNHLRFNLHSLNSSYQTDQEKASTIVHEMIHAITQYAIDANERGDKALPKNVLEAAKSLVNIYNQIKDNEIFNTSVVDDKGNIIRDYGVKDVHEMISELANPEFRDKLKQIEYNGRSVWQRIWDALKSMFTQSSDVTNPTAYDSMAKALDVLINEFSVDAYQKYSGLEESAMKLSAEETLRFREKDEPKELIAVHNISEDNLKKVLEAGSFIMPSIAITKADMGHTDFGEISLLFDKSTINPSDRRNKVYGGDAWTPRFPRIGVKLNDKVVSRINKKAYELIEDRRLREIFSLSSEVYPDNIEKVISDYGVEGYYNKEWMKLAYLLDNGKKVKIPTKAKAYGIASEDIVRLAKEKGLSVKEIYEDYNFYKNNPDFVAQVKEARDEARLSSIPEEQRDEMRERMQSRSLTEAAFDSYIRGALEMENDLAHGGLKEIVDRQALRDLIEKKVKTDNAEYNKWVDNLFEGIVEKRGIRNNRDWYTPSGNLRPWGQLYDPATPANILKYMLAENEQGGSGGLFDSNIMGASAETYESIEEIREKGKQRLKKLPYEEYDEWSNSVAERMAKICDDFLSPSQKNSIGGAIDAKIEITNAVAKDKTAKGIYKHMKREYPNFTMEHAKQVEEIVKEIQEFATGYFEAKPQRLVSVNEVMAAVVPSNASKEIVDALKSNGIEVVTYKKGDEEARKRVVKRVSSSMGIRFRDGKEKSLETALLEDESSFKGTAVSSDDGAKVLKDIDNAISEYENKSTQTKNFIGDVARALGIDAEGKSSKYATFEAMNGDIVTIRISDHNATVSNFDNNGEENGVSIVVSRRPNEGITNDGDAHVVEFFYSDKKLKSSEDKPLVEILKSIKQTLYSGEYKDNTGLAEREEVNDRLREGMGAISDREVSYENDPIAKFQGKPRYYGKRAAAFAERERRRMKQAVKEVAKKLGVTVDIVEDAALLQGRKARAKGWFDVNNGKIVVVIPNHVSAWDAVQTVLHEGIAHHGLRKMFGKHFDTFIENVYANADAEVREKIHDLARLNGLDLAKATEEYLASLAEDTNFERAQHTGWWDKIKQFFVEMLTKAGVKLDIKLTDNELRYILWRSYKNLVEPGSVRTFAGVAEDVVMQSRLSVGNHTAATPSQHRGLTRAERERERIHRTGRVDTSFMIPRVAESDLVNERFNEQLEGLNEENGRSVILSLGYPSDALLASGVENMPIRLYGSKLLAKAKKHGYKTTDIKGLPMALQHPIAVFEGSTAGSHAILTELSINGKNVLVSLSVGKGGHDVDFNIISSIYGKNEDSVLRWINDGKMRFVDKGKALDYLSVSAPIAEAQDNQELSDAAKVVKSFENPTADDGILFRRGGTPMGDGTREEYDRRVRTSKLLKDGRKSKFALTRYNAMEAFVNELYSLEIAQDIIEKKYGIKLGSTYDAVKAENALSSTNLREYERFRKGMYEDMVSITDGWMQSGEEDGDSVRRYLICKSGLERNREFTVRDAINERIDGEKLPMLGMVTSRSEREALERKFAEKRDALRQAYAQERDALRQRLKDGDIGYAEFNRLSDEVALRHSGKEKIMDYSGLTSVTGDSENFRDMAESLVLDFEARHGDAPQLWNAMNRCTKATLQKSYDSGLMSKREFDHISQMFEWYIPMRGFSERTAEDVYSYINEDTGAFSATVKAAKGHLTESDDPLALIGNMMQSAILQGNRNKMKLKFLNMVQTYPSDLFVVDKVWLVEQADGSWKSEYPEIREDMSADEVAASLVAFEEKMDGLRTAKKARRYRGGLDVDFIIEEPIHKMQHAVSVMRSGERVMVYVNGNPRVAQALNGELKDKNQSIALELWDKYLRWYSASKTSYDVNFVLANLTRDTEHATMMTLMSEGAGESGRFMLNIVPSFLATLRGIRNEVKPTVAARRKKKDEKSERYDRYFGEFLRYGGETGYSHLLSVDDWKSMNDRRMTRLRGLAKGRAHAGRVLEYISDAFDYLNRIAEDTTRFNVYSRCRERGMDIGSSILAAKEITTNFNRKGSGRTPGLWGVLANIVRRWIPFANPIIQGMYRFFRVGAEHKAAFAAVCASHVALGIAIPLLNEFLHAVAGGDDDDEYMNQNDYTRRNNLMLFLGGGYLKVPLAPMFRELYGLGDIFYCSMRGYLSASDAALESVGQIRSMLSIEGQSGDEFSLIRLLTPDQFDWLNDIEQNVTFTGAPIYKDTPYQEWTPEHEKVYKDVWSPLVDVSRLVNRAMGGSDDVAAERSSKWINPAVWQYALSEIGGGPLKFVGDLTGMATDLVKGDFVENFSWYNVPVAKRFWTSPDDRTLDASLNRRYYDVMENEHDRSEHLLRTYKRKATDSVAGYAEKLDEFMKSPTYQRYALIHEYKSVIDMLSKELKSAGATNRDELEDTIRQLKIEMLDELEAMEK